MKKTKKVVAALCAVAMLASVLVAVPPVEQAYADTRQELQEQLSAAEQKAKEYKEQIEALQKDKEKALQTKMLLDQRNAVLRDQISTVQKQISYTTDAIAHYEQQETEQYKIFCKQVRQEEERGSISYWSVIFKATGFADLLSRIDFINEVMDYNQRVIEDLKNLRAQLTRSRTELEEQKVTLDAIGKPDKVFKSVLDPLEVAAEHERYVSALINDIYHEAYQARDYRTMKFLDWFVDEQREEEENADSMISRYQLFGSDPRGLYLLDQEYAGRVYTAPSLVL